MAESAKGFDKRRTREKEEKGSQGKDQVGIVKKIYAVCKKNNRAFAPLRANILAKAQRRG